MAIFERSTFLLLSHFSLKESYDRSRIEKVSGAMKHLNMKCNKLEFKFKELVIRREKFTAMVT